jgi:hypothetical protein
MKIERHPYPRAASIVITIDADKELELPPFEISFDVSPNNKGKLSVNVGYISVVRDTQKPIVLTEPVIQDSIYVDKAADGSLVGVEVLTPPIAAASNPEIIDNINKYITESEDEVLATAMGLVTSAWSACKLTLDKLESAQERALDILKDLLDEEDNNDDEHDFDELW